MKYLSMIAVSVVAACGTNATKEDSRQLAVAATAATSSARARAITHAEGQLDAHIELSHEFTGTCARSGSVTISGICYADLGGSNEELKLVFSNCEDENGVLDGEVRWTSTASGLMHTQTLAGTLDYVGSSGAASCDLDLGLTVNPLGIRYSGSVCGYDARIDLGL